MDSGNTDLIKGTIVGCVSVFIIVSNIINVFVLKKVKGIPPVARICLLNLSFSDMLVGTVACLPCTSIALNGQWIYGEVWCQIAGMTHGVSVTVSIWSLAVVSVDRFVAITKPLYYHANMTSKMCYVILGFIWIVSVLTFLLPIWLKSDFIYYQYDLAEGMCGLYWEFRWFCIITAIYIPLGAGATIVITTVKTLRSIKISVMVNTMSHQNAPMEKGYKKAAQILVITAIVYFTMWGPYVIEVIVISIDPTLIAPAWVRFALIWMANSNSFINVFIYSATYKSYRDVLKNTFMSILRCEKLPESPNEPIEH